MASSYQLLFWLTQAVNLSIVVILCVWVINYAGGLAWSPNYSLQFNWHIVLLTIGLVNITALVTMPFRSVRWLTRVRVKQVHAAMAANVLVMVAVGYWAVLEPHIVYHKQIFTSLHSWVGTFTVILFLLQAVVGSATYLWPGLSLKFRSPYTPLHVFFGLSIFVLGAVTTLLGLFEKVKKMKAFSGLAVLMNICGMLIVVLVLLVMYIQTKPEYKRDALIKSSKAHNPA